MIRNVELIGELTLDLHNIQSHVDSQSFAGYSSLSRLKDGATLGSKMSLDQSKPQTTTSN